MSLISGRRHVAALPVTAFCKIWYSVTKGRQCNGLGAVCALWVLLLPGGAMHKRGLCRCAVSVCLSVCPTVCHLRVFCWMSKKRILKLFSQSRRLTVLSFPYKNLWHYSDGDPLTGASNVGGVWKQEALLSHRGRAMFRVWLVSFNSTILIERSLLSVLYHKNPDKSVLYQ